MQRFLAALTVGTMATVLVTGCAKSSSTSTSTDTTTATATEAAASTAPAASTASTTAASGGASVYQANCSSCHQSTGEGVPGAFPPLAGNPAVTGDTKNLIHIVKYGMSGKVVVKGVAFNGMMPAWGTQLSDKDVASVVSYVRSSWGNSASAVTPADVAAVAK